MKKEKAEKKLALLEWSHTARVIWSGYEPNSYNQTTAWLTNQIEYKKEVLKLLINHSDYHNPRKGNAKIYDGIKLEIKQIRAKIRSNKKEGLPSTVQPLGRKDLRKLMEESVETQTRLSELTHELMSRGVSKGPLDILTDVSLELYYTNKFLLEVVDQNKKAREQEKARKKSIKENKK